MATDKKIKEQKNHILYLAIELLVNIFSRLPANFLHESVRLVCKHWASVIRNRLLIEAHLHKSKSGLFIFGIYSRVPAHFLEFNGQDLVIRDVRRWFPGPMVASCDGIALFTDSNSNRLFWVANPVTMQMLPLPPLGKTIPSFERYSHISRIPSTGECKVVFAYEDDFETFHWFVLTVGVDQTWRKLNHKHTFVVGHEGIDDAVFSIGGVVYWPYHDFVINGTKYFLAMDMAKEKIYSVAGLSGCNEPHAYLQMGEYLSAFLPNHSRFEVRILKDWQAGEWCKMYDINVEMIEATWDKYLLPVAWMNDNEVVIFKGMTYRVVPSLLAYKVKEDETKIVDLSSCGERFITVAHTNTLVSW